MSMRVKKTTAGEIVGTMLRCKSCGLIVVVGNGVDNGKFFHETPLCPWFVSLFSADAEDLGEQQIDLSLVTPPSVDTN